MVPPREKPEADDEAWIIYDGDCPFCSAYVRMVRLKESLGAVHLLNARDGGPLVDEVQARGLSLDEGMVLKWQGRFYHGADCINMLALMSTPSSAFNRLNGWLFRSPTVSRVMYPVLRAGRNAALFLLGRKKIKYSSQ